MSSPKTILISGASTGIGKSFVLRISEKYPEYKIITLTWHKPEYDTPNNVEMHLVDITNHSKVKRIVNKILKEDSIDVLINNAGNGWRGMVEDTSIDEAKQQLELNVWSAINLTQLVLPNMRSKENGHIINISSVAAFIDYGTIGYYSATKAFLEKISSVLALEVAPWNIQVSVFAPGAVRTKFGHNMINIKKYKTGDYADSYREWARRFEIMFQKPLSSDEAADQLIRLVEKPKRHVFLTSRDTFYSYLHRILPRRLFNNVLLKRYMKI